MVEARPAAGAATPPLLYAAIVMPVRTTFPYSPPPVCYVSIIGEMYAKYVQHRLLAWVTHATTTSGTRCPRAAWLAQRSHSSIAVCTAPQNSSRTRFACYYYQVQKVPRRGGLIPVLAPRMPVITEDVGKSKPYMRHSTAKGYHRTEIVFELRERKTGVRFNEPATNLATRHTR